MGKDLVYLLFSEANCIRNQASTALLPLLSLNSQKGFIPGFVRSLYALQYSCIIHYSETLCTYNEMMNDIVAEINAFMMFQAEPVSQQGQHLHVDSAQQESGDVRPGIEEELGFRAKHLHRARAGDTG